MCLFFQSYTEISSIYRKILVFLHKVSKEVKAWFSDTRKTISVFKCAAWRQKTTSFLNRNLHLFNLAQYYFKMPVKMTVEPNMPMIKKRLEAWHYFLKSETKHEGFSLFFSSSESWSVTSQHSRRFCKESELVLFEYISKMDQTFGVYLVLIFLALIPAGRTFTNQRS